MNRVIEWFAKNSVAANLLMIMILAAGLLTAPRIKQEVFPEFALDIITVSVVYRGAAPEEVEEGVCVRVEEAIQGLEGIKRITSTANEGVGTVTVELALGADPARMLDDIKSRVDAIDTFPEETEQPVIREITNQRQVIDVAVSGDTDETTLKYLAEQVRDEIAALPDITLVSLSGARPYEISIEVSESSLRQHGLTFDQVANAVRRSSIDLPGGSVQNGWWGDSPAHQRPSLPGKGVRGLDSPHPPRWNAPSFGGRGASGGRICGDRPDRALRRRTGRRGPGFSFG